MKQSVFIFDADGVLCDFGAPEPDDRVLAHVAAILDRGMFAAINTGRDYSWVEENIVRRIRHKLHDPADISRLFVSSEMGGLGVEFKGETELRIPSAFSLTPEQIAKAKHVFEQHPKYADTMYWHDAKLTMTTFVRNDATPIGEFHAAQKEFAAILEDSFSDQHIKISKSDDAVDVITRESGKWAGAQLIYDWLRRVTDVPHDHFTCYGDSMVDYDMAKFFAAQNHDTVFVFTGSKFDDSDLDPSVTLVKTEYLYCEGTYQHLQSLLQDVDNVGNVNANI